MTAEVRDGLRYTKDHEWLRVEGDEGVIGITAYAADELGDIVFVELPATGKTLAKSASFGVIESVKTASDLYSPVAGEVIAVNEALNGAPEVVNTDPYGDGWMIRVRLEDASAADALLDADAYRELTAGG
jgi:glycine cleavage system H protein